jgi:hypothetical protein
MIKKTISPTLIVFLIFYVLVTFSPFLVIFGGKVPIDIEIEPAFISGLITLSGVLVGFVTAIVATRQPLPSWVAVMLLVNWAWLLITATAIFYCALGISPPIYTMTYTMCSLISNHFTAFTILILRLFSK